MVFPAQRLELVGHHLDPRPPRGLEEARVGRGDAVPPQRVEPGREELRWIEALLADRPPGLVAQDTGVDLLLPQGLERLALGVVVEAREADEVLVGGLRRGDDVFDEVLTRADADDLAGLGDGPVHRGGLCHRVRLRPPVGRAVWAAGPWGGSCSRRSGLLPVPRRAHDAGSSSSFSLCLYVQGS